MRVKQKRHHCPPVDTNRTSEHKMKGTLLINQTGKWLQTIFLSQLQNDQSGLIGSGLKTVLCNIFPYSVEVWLNRYTACWGHATLNVYIFIYSLSYWLLLYDGLQTDLMLSFDLKPNCSISTYWPYENIWFSMGTFFIDVFRWGQPQEIGGDACVCCNWTIIYNIQVVLLILVFSLKHIRYGVFKLMQCYIGLVNIFPVSKVAPGLISYLLEPRVYTSSETHKKKHLVKQSSLFKIGFHKLTYWTVSQPW